MPFPCFGRRFLSRSRTESRTDSLSMPSLLKPSITIDVGSSRGAHHGVLLSRQAIEAKMMDESAAQIISKLNANLESIAEPDTLESQVPLDKCELLRQRDEIAVSSMPVRRSDASCSPRSPRALARAE